MARPVSKAVRPDSADLHGPTVVRRPHSRASARVPTSTSPFRQFTRLAAACMVAFLVLCGVEWLWVRAVTKQITAVPARTALIARDRMLAAVHLRHHRLDAGPVEPGTRPMVRRTGVDPHGYRTVARRTARNLTSRHGWLADGTTSADRGSVPHGQRGARPAPHRGRADHRTPRRHPRPVERVGNRGPGAATQ